MSAEGAALAGRELAASLMVDRCDIGRVTGRVVDPDTGAVSDSTEPVYSGPCRVRPGAVRQSGLESAGERLIVMGSYVVTVPMTEVGIVIGDVLTVTACAIDPALVGTVLRVRDVTKGSHITARRLVCEERET